MEPNTQVVTQPMQWASTKDILEVEPVSDKDSGVLRKLREVLIAHDAIDRFGVMLIHKHFDLNENEQLVEFTDTENRRLTIQPMADSDDLNTIQTAWRFSKHEGGMEPLTYCVNRCFNNPQGSHRTQHTPG
jgi:hypothetical protein